MIAGSRRRALQALGLLHPRPEAVTAPLFGTHAAFFLASDKVQVKYEMLRAHQADYEGLRAAVLATGALPADVAAARFHRRGLAGLIAWPAAEPVFAAGFRGAARPAWSPYADPRLEALAAAYRLLLAPDAGGAHRLAITRGGRR